MAELADAGDSKRQGLDLQCLLLVAKISENLKTAKQFTLVELEKRCEGERTESKGFAHHFAHHCEAGSGEFSEEFLELALQVFQPLTSRTLTRADLRRILESLKGLLG